MVDKYIPTSIKDALEYLNTHDATIVSGGTDLMVQRRNWADLPPFFDKDVLFIFNLEEMKYIKEDKHYTYIGANYPLSKLLVDDLTPELLRKTIEVIASPALRNMATIAGNIGNASPAGDTLPILYILNATLKIQSAYNIRVVPISEVILGPRKTTIQSNEMITEIIIPKCECTHTVFNKVGGRKADAISKVSFSGLADIKNGIVKDLRIAFGAVAPVVQRIHKIEQKYIKMSVDELQKRVEEIKNDYKPYITPIDDQRSNKEYRLTVALNLLEQFILNL